MQSEPPFLTSSANLAHGRSDTLSAVFPPYFPEVIIVVMLGAIKRISVMAETG
jgi:hypothetical protein